MHRIVNNGVTLWKQLCSSTGPAPGDNDDNDDDDDGGGGGDDNDDTPPVTEGPCSMWRGLRVICVKFTALEVYKPLMYASYTRV